jgi:hypothetical protein
MLGFAVQKDRPSSNHHFSDISYVKAVHNALPYIALSLHNSFGELALQQDGAYEKQQKRSQD